MSLKIKNNWDKHITRQNASKMHKEVFSMLKKKFKLYKIKQEYPIQIWDEKNTKHTLFFDFFIPELSFAIECQGKQHLEPNAFFDSSVESFETRKKNDELKIKWCSMNEVQLIEFIHGEKVTDSLMEQKMEEDKETKRMAEKAYLQRVK